MTHKRQKQTFDQKENESPREAEELDAQDAGALSIPESSLSARILGKRPPGAKQQEFLRQHRYQQAATKIQSTVRKHQTQKKIVLPKQIYQFLSQYPELLNEIHEEVDLVELSQVLAREIMELLSQPHEIEGHGKRLYLGKKIYLVASMLPLSKLSAEKAKVPSEQIELPVGLWVKKIAGGVELELINQYLGEGTYKKVLASTVLQIDLTTKQHLISAADTVLVQSKDEQKEAHTLTGLRLIRSTFSEEELANPNLRLAGLLTHLDRHSDGTLEARDVALRGDLDRWNNLTRLEFARCFADVATTLELFHAKSLVHRDIAPRNILISKGSEARGFLSDFDLSRIMGHSTLISRNPYYDELGQNGIVTPLCDILGLAQVVAQRIFHMEYGSPSRINLTKAVNELSLILKAQIQTFTNLGELSADQTRTMETLAQELEILTELYNVIWIIFDMNHRSLDSLEFEQNDLYNRLLRRDTLAVPLAYQFLLSKFPQWNSLFPALKNFYRRLAAISIHKPI